MNILKDINLDEIKFSPDGRDISINFLNMSDGSLENILECKSVYYFKFQNCFEVDDGFACYVGEVNYELIKNSELSDWLAKIQYGFYNNDRTPLIPTKTDLYSVHIEGGEIIIELVCEKMLLNKKLLK